MIGILADCAIKVSLILGIAFGVGRLLRRRSAAMRHMMWSAACLSAVVLPLFNLLLPSWQTRLAIPASAAFLQSSLKPTATGTPPAGVVAGEKSREARHIEPAQAILSVWALGLSV